MPTHSRISSPLYKKSHAHLLWACQSVEKPLSLSKNGVWGIAPSRVRAAAPHSAPARMPGVYAQRLYARTHTSGRTKSVQDAPTTNDHDCRDAKPTKHTQPFTTGKGFGVRVREFALFYKNRLFLQPEEEIPRLFSFSLLTNRPYQYILYI